MRATPAPSVTIRDRLLLPTHYLRRRASADEECHPARGSMRRKGAPASSQESTMIGIDVAKDTLAVCWWPAGASAPKWERSYANSKAGLRRLLKDTPPEEPWV